MRPGGWSGSSISWDSPSPPSTTRSLLPRILLLIHGCTMDVLMAQVNPGSPFGKCLILQMTHKRECVRQIIFAGRLSKYFICRSGFFGRAARVSVRIGDVFLVKKKL